MSRRTVAVLSTALLVLIPASPLAQRTVTRSIFVDAVDSGGKPVLNLTAEDFQITENGAKRAVTRAALGTAPMRMVLFRGFEHRSGPDNQQLPDRPESPLVELAESEEIVFVSTGGRLPIARRLTAAATSCARKSRGSHPRAAPTRSTTPCSRLIGDS